MAAVSKSAAGTDNEGAAAAAGVAGMGLGAGDTTAGVEKIRELLFGNQMSDYDRRFTTLEDRFQQSIRDLESETARNLAGLESSIKKQLESVGEPAARGKGAARGCGQGPGARPAGALPVAGQAPGPALGPARQTGARLHRTTGHETQSLREEIKRRNDDTRNTIERMFAELSSVKTDRNLLAGLFVEIAKCLNQDIAPKRIGKIGNGE